MINGTAMALRHQASMLLPSQQQAKDTMLRAARDIEALSLAVKRLTDEKRAKEVGQR